MSTHEINIKTPVYSMDGADLGDVTRLFVDVAHNRLVYLAVDKGLFADERLVPVELIDHSTADGVTLSITEAEAEQLPPFIEREMVQMPGTIEMATAGGATVRLPGSGERWHEFDTRGAEFPSVTGSSLFMQAPIGRVVTREISSVPEASVAISEGTDVFGSDGYKLGRVDEVLFDDEYTITGFVVKAGLLFRHDVRIPMEWVAGIAHDRVRLNVTKDEAEQGARVGA